VIKDDKGATRPASIYNEGGKTYLAAVVDHVPARGETSYQLIATEPSDTQAGLTLELEGENVKVLRDAKPVTTYRSGTGPKPFYWPLDGPTGAEFTRAFPMKVLPNEKHDHPHQRSMWFAHGKVNGVDFWSEAPGHGFIIERSRSLLRAAPASGAIKTWNDWVGPDNQIVCSDVRVIRSYATESTRVIDVDVTLNAPVGDVVFADTKEGTFGIRVATSMDVTSKPPGKITSSTGLVDAAAWGKPADWVDYVGPVAGRTVGIAVLDHPTSFRHPTTWHVRTYGLFAANPFGWKDFGLGKSGAYTLPMGQSIQFSYRVVLHAGDTAAANLPAAYSAYANPPRVEVKLD
jgi:hypothetical protein